jgi:hypothetical protein
MLRMYPVLLKYNKIKYLILLLSVAILSCKKDVPIVTNSCTSIGSYNDTLVVGNYKLWLICLTASNNIGTLEVIDKNNNTINVSPDFSINLVQVQNGNNCWETKVIEKRIGDANSFSSVYNGLPAWAYDSKTKVIIQLTISGMSYYIIDEQVNK